MKRPNTKYHVSLLLSFVATIRLFSGSSTLGAGAVPPEPSYAIVGSGNYVPALLRAIEQSEYEIHWQPKVDAYQSPNRANNLRFTYLEDGFVAERRAPSSVTDFWRIRLTLGSFGSARATRLPGRAALEVNKDRATVSTDDLIFEYTNERQGMRQTFIVPQKLGRGGLELMLKADLEGVAMLIDETGGAVYFINDFEEVMRYTDLKAWDAEGSGLPARFEVRSGNRFAIVVDDAGARYPVTVDPLSLYWSAVGGQGSAKYGYSVAFGNSRGVGSVGDIIVGAPYYDNGNTDEGSVFVYYGGVTGTPTTPSWTGEGDQDNAHFGWSVATADVNGDGYDDLVVGSPDHSVATQGSHEGMAFVWLAKSDGTGLGANGHPSNASWSKTGENSNAKFGFSVASAGDVNNDGYKDIIIGAPHNDIYQSGRVYVYHGSASGLSATANWTARSGLTTGPEFGWSVASAGDVNGDGYGDVIVGAPLYSNGQSSEGVAVVWHGSATGLTPNPGSPSNAARLLEKNQASASFGFAVASAGDVNGDGYSDVIVGAPKYDNGQTDEGAVFVYYGSSTGIPATEAWSAESNQASAQFGYSVAATDLNVPYDGYSDIVIGAPYYDYAATIDGGGAFVWYGSSAGLGPNGNPSNAAESFFDLTNNGAHSGWSVAAGDNVKYRLHGGIIIGAPDEASGGLTGRGGVTAWTQ